MCSFLLALTVWLAVVGLLSPPRWCVVVLALAILPVTYLLSWGWSCVERFFRATQAAELWKLRAFCVV